MFIFYFFNSYPRKQRDNDSDIYFVVPENNENKPQYIYIDETFQNQIYYYKKIYKVKKSIGRGNKKTDFYLEFEIGDEKYIISFDSKTTFVYDIVLNAGKRIIDIRRKINQNLEYKDKMNIFIEALKKNKEGNKIDELYKETINLYSKKKGFSFLIEIFLKIYKDKKDLYN